MDDLISRQVAIDAVDNANPCETCWIAQNYNLEDDDSPCLDCEEE